MIEHAFRTGNGELCQCGETASKHRARRKRSRPEHAAVGDPCEKCGRGASRHFSKKAIQSRQRRDKNRPNRQGRRTIIGIDGEGFDLPDGRHIYTLLLAVNEHGKTVGRAWNPKGLSSRECFEMIMNLPRNSLRFVFMGSYDWAKMVEDLSPTDIYYIMHPEARRTRLCTKCKKSGCNCGVEKRTVTNRRAVTTDKYGNELRVCLDWFNGSFTVAEPFFKNGKRVPKKYAREVKIWDCFKFFQSSFVKAIEAWKVGTPEQVARIAAMKEKRGSFDEETPEAIEAYCAEECHLLAVMMRKVLTACEMAGIKLKRYDGAGAIASALLKAHDIEKFLGPKLETFPPELRLAIMSAYFGGRFENSHVGTITERVYNRDIFSAYPYAIYSLPCLECGEWRRVTKNVMRQARAASLACVKFDVETRSEEDRTDIPWCPLPFRTDEGSICFPTGFQGWSWLPEFEQALKGWPDLIEPLEAWLYETKCGHAPLTWIADAYKLRCQWGKDGPGIVMKLGPNACAGKFMQSAGDSPPFKSWVFGGMITATTRGQALHGIRLAKDRWNVLAIATDGLFATEDITLPEPRDTGTAECRDSEGILKPLGGWGREIHEKGVFFVKPGLYFDEPRRLMRARGIGRKEFKDNAERIVKAFQTWDRRSELKIRVNSRRFFGARSSVLAYSQCGKCGVGWPGHPEKGCPKCGGMADSFRTTMMQLSEETIGKNGKPKRKPTGISAYGRWAKRPIDIEFACLPKREFIALGGTAGRMRVRDMGGAISLPYLPGMTTPEGLEARMATEQALEEPDWNDQDDAGD